MNGGSAVGYGGNHLTESLSADVTHSKDTGNRGARGLVGYDIAVVVQLQRSVQKFGGGLSADADEEAAEGYFPFRAVLEIFDLDTCHTAVGKDLGHGAVPHEFHVFSLHERLVVDPGGAEGITAMDDVDLIRDAGEVESVGYSRVAAAHHGYGLSLIEAAVAMGAVVDAFARQGTLVGKPQLAGIGTRGDDDGTGGVGIDGGLDDFYGGIGEVNLHHILVEALGSEALGLHLHIHAQRDAIHTLGEARIIVDDISERHLSTGGHTLQNGGIQACSGCVEGGSIAGGTMAHAWVQMFVSEYEAFKAYVQMYPNIATLLVDTYNTLKSGVPNAIRVFNEVLKPLGITKCGIRLDSGDMAYLTRQARKMLDEAGWTECAISVSNSLDEYIIRDILQQGAQIDLFGVGERLITARSEPVFGGVYKLAAVEEPDGTILPKSKISENVTKITNPHYKKLYRFFAKDTGKALADYMTVYDETVDDSGELEIFDPEATWKTKRVYNFTAKELQVPIFKGGELVYQVPALDDVRTYCAQQVDTLWDEVKRFDNPQTYYVDLSQKLWDVKYGLLKRNGKQ